MKPTATPSGEAIKINTQTYNIYILPPPKKKNTHHVKKKSQINKQTNNKKQQTNQNKQTNKIIKKNLNKPKLK